MVAVVNPTNLNGAGLGGGLDSHESPVSEALHIPVLATMRIFPFGFATQALMVSANADCPRQSTSASATSTQFIRETPRAQPVAAHHTEEQRAVGRRASL